VEVDAMPGGRLTIRPARGKGRIEDAFGMLAGYTDKVATIEEMNEAIADGWAGKR
jgi:hypothetical protein